MVYYIHLFSHCKIIIKKHVTLIEKSKELLFDFNALYLTKILICNIWFIGGNIGHTS